MSESLSRSFYPTSYEGFNPEIEAPERAIPSYMPRAELTFPAFAALPDAYNAPVLEEPRPDSRPRGAFSALASMADQQGDMRPDTGERDGDVFGFGSTPFIPNADSDNVFDSIGNIFEDGGDTSDWIDVGYNALRLAGVLPFAEGGLVDFPDDEQLSPEYSNFAAARDYFQELNRADAQRNLRGLPEISVNTGFDRNRGVNLVPYGGRIRTEIPVTQDGGMLDLGAGYQGATVSGRGFRQNLNLLREAGAGYTFPDGGRLSLDYFDRMDGGDVNSGPADSLNQDVRMPSDAELMGRPVPSRGVRLGYRREFAEGGLVPLAGGGKIAIGPGGGLDDLIPTSINGRRAAALSDGEFVIPADVVSMMGDGSSNAGARRLYDLVKQIREAKTGTEEQAGPLPVGTILKRTLS